MLHLRYDFAFPGTILPQSLHHKKVGIAKTETFPNVQGKVELEVTICENRTKSNFLVNEEINDPLILGDLWTDEKMAVYGRPRKCADARDNQHIYSENATSPLTLTEPEFP